MGYATFPFLAAAAGVNEDDCIERTAMQVGNNMHVANVGAVLLAALVSVRLREPEPTLNWPDL